MMEQRNELLKQMKMTDRQKKGDVQHLLSRSFSRKSIPTLLMPSSPPAEISFAVPQLPTQATPVRGGASLSTPPPPTIAEADETVSIGELSVEPRVLGSRQERGVELIDLSSPQPTVEAYSPPIEEDVPLEPAVIARGSDSPHETRRSSLPAGGGAPWRTTPPRSKTPPKQERRDSDSSSDDSCPEEQSVRTPLLDGEAPATLPVNTQPSIRHYDAMFAEKKGEDEIPLGGTADTLYNHP